jgi:hypothetical protein
MNKRVCTSGGMISEVLRNKPVPLPFCLASDLVVQRDRLATNFLGCGLITLKYVSEYYTTATVLLILSPLPPHAQYASLKSLQMYASNNMQ